MSKAVKQIKRSFKDVVKFISPSPPPLPVARGAASVGPRPASAESEAAAKAKADEAIAADARKRGGRRATRKTGGLGAEDFGDTGKKKTLLGGG